MGLFPVATRWCAVVEFRQLMVYRIRPGTEDEGELCHVPQYRHMDYDNENGWTWSAWMDIPDMPVVDLTRG